MTISNTFRWTGALSNDWSDDNGTESNWSWVNNPGGPPSFPGAGDLAIIDIGGDVDITSASSSDAEELQIANGTTVTFSSGNFGFGADGQGGLSVDGNSALVVDPLVSVADTGSLDVIGLTSGGSLEIDAGGGFTDYGMTVGADAGSSGEVTVDNASLFVMQSVPGAADGVLSVGDQGDGTLNVSGGSLVSSATAILGVHRGATGTVTVEGSTWSGGSLTVGQGGAGTADIEDGSTVTFNSILVGPSGDLAVSAAAGLSSTVTASSFTLCFGTLDVTGGGELLMGATTGAAGAITINSIDTLVGLGTVNADIDLENGGSVEAFMPMPGALTINGDIDGQGNIEPLMTLEVNGAIGQGVDIAFNANGVQTDGDLILDVPTADHGTITGFGVGNAIDLKGVLYTDAVFTQGVKGAPGTLTLSGDDSHPPLTLSVEGNYGSDSFVAVPDSDNSGTTVMIACFLAGTRILTDGDETAVEALAIGDRVITRTGEAKPIKWIGRRSYAGRFALGQTHILPICIKAGALADDVPRRDLWLSPQHALYLEGVLIEAKDLVNGVSIIQAAQVDSVEYVHVELDSHDVLIAEGAYAESFIDDGSRATFHNAQEYGVLYPETPATAACYYASRVVEGYELDAARRRIARRAGLRDNTRAAAAPRGSIDVVSPCYIAGWAQNPHHPEAPVCLDIYADGRLIGRTLANRYREDLQRAGLGSGRHSFAFIPPRGVAVTAQAVEVRRSLDGAALVRGLA